MLACSPPNITPNKFILTVYRCVCQLSQYLYPSEQNKVNTLYGCRPPQKSPWWSIIGMLGSLLPLFWSFLGWIFSRVMKSVNFKFNSEGTSNKVAEMVKRGTVMESEPPGRAGVLLGDVSATRPPPRYPLFLTSSTDLFSEVCAVWGHSSGTVTVRKRGGSFRHYITNQNRFIHTNQQTGVCLCVKAALQTSSC